VVFIPPFSKPFAKSGRKIMLTLQAIQSQKAVNLAKPAPVITERQPAHQANALKDKVTISAEANKIQNTSPQHLTEKSVDFSNMTRQQLRDWVNSKIISGEMSLDESTPLVGMTLKISTGNMQPVDASLEKESINFFDNASLGIDGALSRGDKKEAAFVQKALDLMRKFQGRITI
jgi:hypothetical protein